MFQVLEMFLRFFCVVCVVDEGVLFPASNVFTPSCTLFFLDIRECMIFIISHHQ